MNVDTLVLMTEIRLIDENGKAYELCVFCKRARHVPLRQATAPLYGYALSQSQALLFLMMFTYCVLCTQQSFSCFSCYRCGKHCEEVRRLLILESSLFQKKVNSMKDARFY